MAVISFNDGWVCRAPLGPFAAGGEGAPAVPVRLPHDALRDAQRSPEAPSGGAGAYYPPGAFTYLKSFTVPAEWEGRVVRLEVQGAFRRAQVFCSDEFAGNRADGYARFFVDLTPYLRHGRENVLRIEVRSGQDSRWYSGAGLHRPVLLHVDAPVHVVPDGVRVSTLRLEEDQAVVEVATTVANAGLSTRTAVLSTTVTGPDGRQVEREDTPVTLAPGERSLLRQRLYLQDAALWSPDQPSLHTARVGLGGDPLTDVLVTFGVRTVTVDPRKGLRINGDPVLLRGACVHHDNGPLGAAAVGRAEERRVELLKAAGFNAIRAAHNPLSPAMLDACDRLGVLVVDEAFDVWTRFKTPYDYAADFPQRWAADLEAMVAKDHNHPSVVMYSIGNEIVEVGTAHGARLARTMAEHVRTLDPTRLVTNGVNMLLAVLDDLPAVLEPDGGLNEAMASMDDAFSTIGASEAATRRTTESSAALDVLGLNYAESRYAKDRELFPHRVIVGSETFPSKIGTLWPLVLQNPNVIGDFTWTGWDYLGEVGIGATAYAEDPQAVAALEREYPYLTAWCGDLDITGWRRPISYYREIVFGLRTEPYIAVLRPQHHDHTVTMQSPWAWSDSVSSWTWPGHEGAPVTVEVYADADEVALLLDGTELTRAAVGAQRPVIATSETVYRPGELAAVAYRGGREVGRTCLSTARGPARLVVTVDRERLRADDADLAFASIELRDAAGRLITGDDRPVTVQVDGAAVLAGMCSADPGTAARFDACTWTTFDGRALAVLRPTRAGRVGVTVTCGALEPVTLALTAEEIPAQR
ncbi:glycoside hydrolase family 2 TIM barrel-domain containing protein [Kineococcus auxinigenes]|uniref:glycoside hydrolase family 2 TIM barrel-domain containing protein n=1 Tax=unclassified Kineococcus TaxID=2621656 RepID=UPI003D7CFC61